MKIPVRITLVYFYIYVFYIWLSKNLLKNDKKIDSNEASILPRVLICGRESWHAATRPDMQPRVLAPGFERMMGQYENLGGTEESQEIMLSGKTGTYEKNWLQIRRLGPAFVVI